MPTLKEAQMQKFVSQAGHSTHSNVHYQRSTDVGLRLLALADKCRVRITNYQSLMISGVNASLRPKACLVEHFVNSLFLH